MSSIHRLDAAVFVEVPNEVGESWILMKSKYNDNCLEQVRIALTSAAIPNPIYTSI